MVHTEAKHDDPWMDDGNLILEAQDGTLFRVHTSQLRLHSEFWRVTFPAMGPDTTFRADGMIEGCLVVTLAQFSSFDLGNFLRALFYGGAIRVSNLVEFLTAASIARLAHQYDCDHLFQRALTPMLELWPSKRRDWETFTSKLEGRSRVYGFEPGVYPDIHPALVICLAERVKQDILLPAAYHALAQMEPQLAFPLVLSSPLGPIPQELFRLSAHHQQRYSFLRKNYQNARKTFVYRYIKALACPTSGKMVSNWCINKLKSHYGLEYDAAEELVVAAVLGKTADQSTRIFSFFQRLPANYPGKMCNPCGRVVDCIVRDVMQELWDAVPKYLGLNDWKSLAGIPNEVKNYDYETLFIRPILVAP